MNEREWLRIAGEALQSLKRIEKTVSEPQTLSAHRIAANRKMSKAMDYIAEATITVKSLDESDSAVGSPYHTFTFIPVKKILDDIREILTSRD